MGKFVWCNWDVDELKAQAAEIEKGNKVEHRACGMAF